MSRNKNQSKDNKTNIEEQVWNNLSCPQLSLDKQGLTYTFLNLNGKSLESLSSFTMVLTQFKFITKVDLSNNLIIDFVQLQNMQDLIHLDLQNNSVKDIKGLQNEEGFKNLQYLNLSGNKVLELGSIKSQNLKYLNLQDNRVEKVENFEGHPKLEYFNFTNNKISNLQKFVNLPNLKELYMIDNKIKLVQGLEGLSNLTVLNLRKNLIEVFEETFPALENLRYLNLRENKIEKLDEIPKLQALPVLETLVLSFNPIINKLQEKFYFEIMNILPKIKRVNKIQVNNQVKQRWIDFNATKWRQEQEEKARIEREEQEKERLAAEAQEQES